MLSSFLTSMILVLMLPKIKNIPPSFIQLNDRALQYRALQWDHHSLYPAVRDVTDRNDRAGIAPKDGLWLKKGYQLNDQW